MVLEEEAAAAVAPTRPDELITPQSGGGSRWFVQHMPRSGSAAGGSRQISPLEESRPSPTLPASTSEDAEEGTAVATIAAQVVVAAARQAEEPN